MKLNEIACLRCYDWKEFCPILVRTEPIWNGISNRCNATFFNERITNDTITKNDITFDQNNVLYWFRSNEEGQSSFPW